MDTSGDGMTARGLLLALMLSCLACHRNEPPEADAERRSRTGVFDDGESTCNRTRVPLRRLSAREYRNTIAEVLGINPTTYPAPPYEIDERFLNGAFDTEPTRQFMKAERVAALVHLTAGAADAFWASSGRSAAMLRSCASPDASSTCIDQFINELVSRAFRHPIGAAELSRYRALYSEESRLSGPEVAARALVQAILLAPQTIFRLESAHGAQDGAVSASRLSYLLWGSPPDHDLAEAALDLANPERLNAQVDRMLADPRAREGVLAFFRQWFAYISAGHEFKTPKLWPKWSEDIARALIADTDRFLVHVIFEGGGTLRDLFTDRSVYPSQTASEVYDLPHQTDSSQWLTLPSHRRAGVLTRGAWLSAASNADDSSPAARGAAILQRLLCTPVGSPPGMASLSDLDWRDEVMTTRRRLERGTEAPECQACHGLFNPIGFALETYDALGRWRNEDNGFPVDATADFHLAGQAGTWHGPVELSSWLGDSQRTAECFTNMLARFALGRELSEDQDRCLRHRLHKAFERTGGDILATFKSLATAPDFLGATDDISIAPGETTSNPIAPGNTLLARTLTFVAAEYEPWVRSYAAQDPNRFADFKAGLVQLLK